MSIRRAYSFKCERCLGRNRDSALMFAGAAELCPECYGLPRRGYADGLRDGARAGVVTGVRLAVAVLFGAMLAGAGGVVVAWAVAVMRMGRWWR